MKSESSGGNWLPVLLGLPMLCVAAGEWSLRHPTAKARHTIGIAVKSQHAATQAYAAARDWTLDQWPYLLMLGVVLIPALWAFRQVYQWWHNVFIARLSGTDFGTKTYEFPKLEFELIPQIAQTPPGHYFIGHSPEGTPVTVEESVFNTHVHVVGPTGCGKTESLIFNLMLQDALAGKGATFIEAKGAYSAIERFKTIATLARRRQDVRIFSLEFPHHSYNPVHLGPAGDPLVTAERVFSDFAMDNEYYRGQAKLLFYNLVRVMAGTGKPFNLIDVRLAVSDDEVLDYVMEISDETKAKHTIGKQMQQLGKRRNETFTGLYNALADYDPGGAVSEALNSYDPDIVIEDVVNQRQLVYFHLSVNRYQLLAPSVGKIVLRHLASVGAARDARPREYDQTPFSISVDECQNFLFEALLNSLTMLRSARMQVRLAHQTLAQLENESKAFERTVRTNTRFKVLFFSDDPDHLELVARSYGTVTTYKKTVRFSPGPLWTHINSGDASNREVQEFRIHPDALKSLKECGQGYLLLPGGVQPVSFSTLPARPLPDYPLPRKPAGVGLGLYDKFVAGSFGKPSRAV